MPINIKTDNYLLNSMIKINALVKAAKEKQINALGIADNNMYGALEFYKACKKENIKPIIGLEINVPAKILLYAKNYQGYKSLIKIETKINEQNLKLKEINKENLICVIPAKNKDIYPKLKEYFKNIYIGYEKEEEKRDGYINIKEVRVLNDEEKKYLKYLHAIKTGNIVEEDTNSLFKEEENIIIKECNLKIEKEDLLPKYPCIDSFQALKDLCLKSLKEMFGEKAPRKYIERLKYELSIINKMGFNDYFLIVADYVKYAKNSGIYVGPGRGSAAGSLTAYMLKITEIDPLKYNLLFERFLNPERITMPDIDVDFEDERREEVIDYCIKKYGSKKVALISTFGTLASKQAIRDIGKIMQINDKKIDALCKMLNPKKILKENEKGVNNYLNLNPELKPLYQVASKIEGLKRHTSIHAAGIVISKNNLDENVPLDKNEKYYITEYDKDILEKIGILKMDFLGLKNLTIIKNIINDIPNFTLKDIKENDEETINIFKEANTLGIFQFESPGMINFLKKLKPKNFNDIVAAIALFRPGPMHSIENYIKRKEGKEKPDYFDPSLENVLKPTYGIIIYQEQIMQIANIMAGYTLAEADLLRRAMSKKNAEILMLEKEKFIKGSIQKGYSEELANQIYDLIYQFASYGFNKSHSVAYALISYQMAYLKAHFKQVFIKNLLNTNMQSTQKTKEYINECIKNNIKILKPDINSAINEYTIKDGSVMYPLNSIIPANISKEIIEERKNSKYKDIFDFVCRNKITEENLTKLINAGAFENFNYNRQTLIKNIDKILNYSAIGNYLSENLKPELEIYKEYPKEKLMQIELETFGLYITENPITELKLKHPNIIELKDIKNYFDKQITAIVYAEKIKEIETKNKEKMAFITASDEMGKIEVTIFPKTYAKINIEPNKIYLIKGKVEKRFDEYQIILNDIKKI